MKGFKATLSAHLFELLVLLDALLIFSKYCPQTIVRFYGEVACDQIFSLWLGSYLAKELRELRCRLDLIPGKLSYRGILLSAFHFYINFRSHGR
jgi:hypothetical protein